MKTCSISGCNRPHDSRGYCTKHYDRFRRHGDPYKRKCNANGEGCIDQYGYRLIYQNGKQLPEHRVVMEKHLKRKLLSFKYEQIHHINGNKLDNRIENLLLLSAAEHTILHHRESKIIGNKRICLDCKKLLLLTLFNKDRTTHSGFRPYCKKCHKIRNQIYLNKKFRQPY